MNETQKSDIVFVEPEVWCKGKTEMKIVPQDSLVDEAMERDERVSDVRQLLQEYEFDEQRLPQPLETYSDEALKIWSRWLRHRKTAVHRFSKRQPSTIVSCCECGKDLCFTHRPDTVMMCMTCGNTALGSYFNALAQCWL